MQQHSLFICVIVECNSLNEKYVLADTDYFNVIFLSYFLKNLTF